MALAVLGMAHRALLLVDLPAVTGFRDGQWQNAGGLRALTHEVTLAARLINTPSTGLTLNIVGDRTRQRITEWDLPRKTIEPHDVIGDQAGVAWYSNFGEQSFGKLDPKTGKHTEWPVAELKKGWPTGMLGLRSDKDGNMWLGMMYQGAMAKFDPKTEKFQTWIIPSGGGVVRNMMATADGDLVLACSGRNRVAWVDVN